jgi:hypothetical protein
MPDTFKRLVPFKPLLIACMRSLSHVRVKALGMTEEPRFHGLRHVLPE